MARCENEIRTSGPVDDCTEMCNRHAIAVCFHCGNATCARCMEVCFECSGVFCSYAHLEEHADELGHNPKFRDKITYTARYVNSPALVAGFRR